MSDANRLDKIDTLWSVVRRAHGDRKAEVVEARQALVDRYSGAVRRYLLGALRDQDAMDEVYQNFHVKFMRGAFHKANPAKGQFRDFLRGVLSRLIADYYNRRKRDRMVRLPEEMPAREDPTLDDDEAFARCWRDELLDLTWIALKERESQSGQPFYTVLRSRTDNPELHSPELAPVVGELLRREITVVNLRKMLSRAREEFDALLLDIVEQSLDGATREELEEELINLDLHKYVVRALARRT